MHSPVPSVARAANLRCENRELKIGLATDPDPVDSDCSGTASVARSASWLLHSGARDQPEMTAHTLDVNLSPLKLWLKGKLSHNSINLEYLQFECIAI